MITGKITAKRRKHLGCKCNRHISFNDWRPTLVVTHFVISVTAIPPPDDLMVHDFLQSLELWDPTENNKTCSVPAHDGLIAALADSPQTLWSCGNETLSVCIWPCTPPHVKMRRFCILVDGSTYIFVDLYRGKIPKTLRDSIAKRGLKKINLFVIEETVKDAYTCFPIQQQQLFFLAGRRCYTSQFF